MCLLRDIVKRFEWPLVRKALYKCSLFTIWKASQYHDKDSICDGIVDLIDVLPPGPDGVHPHGGTEDGSDAGPQLQCGPHHPDR